jgi:hypothetical protein
MAFSDLARDRPPLDNASGVERLSIVFLTPDLIRVVLMASLINSSVKSA